MAFPQGVVRIVGDDGAPTSGLEGRSIAISDLGAFFRVLGPDDARLKWQDRYGFDTLGSNGSGRYVYDEYPLLSRIGWMNIDEVTFEGTDLAALIVELEKAASLAGQSVERNLFKRISQLAELASRRSLKVEFGHV